PLQRLPRHPGEFGILGIGDDLGQMRGARRDQVDAQEAGELALACLGVDRNRLGAVIDQGAALEEAKLDTAPDVCIGGSRDAHSSPESRRAFSSFSFAPPSWPLGLATSMASSCLAAKASARIR